MALIPCSECGREISDRALACPKCGAPGRSGVSHGPYGGYARAYEYKSESTLLGLPLIHIATGYDPATGAHRRVARGVIAIGDIAVGAVAIGGIALGGITLGGVAIGLTAFGGAAIGLSLAMGGAAIGYVAVGGAAIGKFAMGGAALGEHVVSAMRQDPQAVAFFERFLGFSLGACRGAS